MSFRSSLLNWHNYGLADRELTYYCYLAQCGIDISLVTYGDARDYAILDKYYPKFRKHIKVIPMLGNNVKNTRLNCIFYSIWFVVKNYKYLQKVDFVKSKQFSGSWLPALVSKFTSAKFVYRYGYDITSFNKLGEKNILRRFTTWLIEKAVTKSAYKVLGTSLQSRNSKLPNFVHQENWIEIELFENKRLFEKPFKIIANGRLEQQKNFQLLLKVVKSLNLNLTLLGDGSQLNELKDYSQSHAIDVDFKGRVPYEKVISLYKENDFFASTTLFEGNPKTIIEALASGLICIVPDIESVTNIVRNGYNGFCHDNTEEGLKEIILKVFNLTEEEKKQISNRAQASVKERHSLKTTAIKELNIYSSYELVTCD